MTKQERRRGPGVGNEHFSILQKPVNPAEAIEGVVKRIDLLGSILCRKIQN